MRHEISLFTLLMGVSLGAAFWASQPKEEKSEDRQLLYRLDPGSIESISYQEEGLSVAIAPRGPGGFWVTETKVTKPKPVNPHSPQTEEEGSEDGAEQGEEDVAAEESAKEPVEETQTFKASSKLKETVLDKLNPFEAERVLEDVPQEQLAEFGLDASDKTLEIRAGGKTYRYAVGKKAYGSPRIFLKEESGRILLVENRFVESIERASRRLYERQLVAFDEEDISHAQVAADGAQAQMAHTVRNAQGKLQWSEDKPDAKANSSYQSWMDKVTRLRLMTYADDAKASELEKVKPFLSITYKNGGKVLDTLHLKKIEVPGEGDKPAETEYWATSNYLQAYGRISNNRATPIENDIGMILKE